MVTVPDLSPASAPATDADPVGAVPRSGVRSFVLAAVVGVALVTPGYLWVACDLWTGRFSLTRYLPYEANFYDLQARSMLAGHLSLARGSLGIEGFVHDGREYTYFGLFPSLLRIPVLAFTRSFDARLTVPSMLLAWLVIAVSASLLVWRVRCYLRPGEGLGRLEAASLGAFVAVVCGGSVLVYLAATPFVFDEDLAWSVALSTAALFFAVGLLERPSGRRVAFCGLLALAANLNRSTTGWGIDVALAGVAIWFALGRGGPAARRLAAPLAGCAVAACGLAATVNYFKFGQLFGLPMQDQVFSQVNHYRQTFLAANGGEVGIKFAPSTVLAYLRPDGIRLTGAFPFVTLPAAPAAALGGVLFDRTYSTGSLTATMPLLVVLGVWGLLAVALTRRSPRHRSLIPLALGALMSAGAIFLWGYIADRYLADFLPALVLGGSVGIVECWRLLSRLSRRARVLATTALMAGAVWSVLVNLSVAVTPNGEWNMTQTANFVSAQASVGTLAGPPLGSRVLHGAGLPEWMPAGTLYEVGSCEGLYISDGDDVSTVPLQRYQHATWLPVSYGPPYQSVIELTIPLVAAGAGGARGAAGTPALSERIVLLRAGPSTLWATVRIAGPKGTLVLRVGDPTFPVSSLPIPVVAGRSYRLDVISDLQLHQMTVTLSGFGYVDGVFTGGAPIEVLPGGSGVEGGPVVARDVTDTAAETSLCRRVTGGS